MCSRQDGQPPWHSMGKNNDASATRIANTQWIVKYLHEPLSPSVRDGLR